MLAEMIFVTPVTADGSVKFLSEWCKFLQKTTYLIAKHQVYLYLFSLKTAELVHFETKNAQITDIYQFTLISCMWKGRKLRILPV